jgi:hypothetical protein
MSSEGDPDYNPTPAERWDQGIDHDPRSLEIIETIEEADRKYGDSYHDWGLGDGDLGQEIAYALDCHFHDKDREDNDEPES